MKLLLLPILLMVLIGCKDKQNSVTIGEISDGSTTTIVQNGIDSQIDTASIGVSGKDNVVMDSSFIKLRRTAAFLDSNLKYGRLAQEMEVKMYKAEADYYRTQDEKYYNLYYKYQKEQWRLVGLCNRYNDSLQNSSK